MSRQSGAWQRGVLRWRYLFAALLILFLGFFLVMRGIQRDRMTVDEAYEQATRAQMLTEEKYNALYAELQQVGSSSYIENIARQNYSFLRPEEKRFEIRNPEDLNGYTYEEMQILQEERKPQ